MNHFCNPLAYARLKSSLLRKGKPIPDNDIWIAATALQHSLKTVTRDKHFASIEGVTVEFW